MVQPAAGKKFKILSLIVVFALPAMIAAGLYYGSSFFNFTPKSQGLLLDPPLSAEKLEITTVSGTPVTAEDFAKFWWLIYVAPTACAAEECAVQAAKLRSIHLALNKNVARVKRLMLLQPHSLSTEQLQAAQQDKQLTIDLLRNPHYLLDNCPMSADQEGVYIMDPLGNIMLCYAPHQEAHAILQDLEKLLKASRIG